MSVTSPASPIGEDCSMMSTPARGTSAAAAITILGSSAMAQADGQIN